MGSNPTYNWLSKNILGLKPTNRTEASISRPFADRKRSGAVFEKKKKKEASTADGR
jgi:hypothetical protein